MKRILLVSFLLVVNMIYAQDKNKTTEQVKPEILVEAQLVAYNKGEKTFNVIAIYKIEKNKIVKVYFN